MPRAVRVTTRASNQKFCTTRRKIPKDHGWWSRTRKTQKKKKQEAIKNQLEQETIKQQLEDSDHVEGEVIQYKPRAKK